MRAYQQGGRFTTDYEVDSILRGTVQDLRESVGMFVDWWVWDPVTTEVDPLYDVGSVGTGKRWKEPLRVPVVVAQVFQGQTVQNDRGFYNTDVLRFTVGMEDMLRFIPDLVENPDLHLRDRVVYRRGVFRPTKLYLRGQVQQTYTVLTTDLNQVMVEELVNDDQFQAYIPEPI